MYGVLGFCYRPVIHSLPNFTLPSNDTLTVWSNGDFGVCFEQLVFVTALNVLFCVASSAYAGAKSTAIQRRSLPLVLVLRLVITLTIAVCSLVEFIAAFWLAKKRPYVVLLAEMVVMITWCVHAWSIRTLGRSIHHRGRGPVTLHSVWFLAFIGTVIKLRTVIRWKLHPLRYQLSEAGVIDEGYFSLLMQISTYVHVSLQFFYAVTLLFSVSQITGDNVVFPKKMRRTKLLNSVSEESEEEEKPLITTDWKPATSSSARKYGTFAHDPRGKIVETEDVDFAKLETSEDRANVFSLLSFWWVEPLMRRGALGLLQKPEDLLQLPASLKTTKVRGRFRDILMRSQGSSESHCHRGVLGSGDPSSNVYESFSEDSKGSPAAEGSQCAPSPSSKTRPRQPTDSKQAAAAATTATGGKVVSLFWSLNQAFGWHYYPLGLLKLSSDLVGFSGPLLLHALVSFMENKTEPMWHGYCYALGLFLGTLIGAILLTHFTYQINKVGLKIRAALVTEIYRKALCVSSTSLSKFSTGQVVNFMSTDTDRIVNFSNSFHQFWSLPFQIIISLVLLYQQVGLASLTGLAFSVLLIPVNRWIAVKIGKLSTEMMAQKDKRVKVMSEVLTGIRVIKFYAWESNFITKILGIRAAELKGLRGRKYLDALCVYFWATTPVLISILTFATYTAMGHTLSAAKVFTSMALFSILISPLNAFPWVVNGLVEAWVSVKRVHAFMELHEVDLSLYYSAELLLSSSSSSSHLAPTRTLFEGTDSEPPARRTLFEGTDSEQVQRRCGSELPESGGGDGVRGKKERAGWIGVPPPARGSVLLIRNGCFTWKRGGGDETTPAVVSESSDEPIEWKLADINLTVKSGQFVGVVGRVGSGKSSLLAAIAAEMRKMEGKISVATLAEGFGLAVQEAWIQYGTVRENILFGLPYEPLRYQAVVSACALEPDLLVLSSGDQTEVGENGVTLSGGQKARLALARAVYQDKAVYLLDDPLAAVDAHVAAHLHTHVLLGLLRDKTRVLCTHHHRFLAEADVVVAMEGGRIRACGPPSQVLRETEEEGGEGGEGGEGAQKSNTSDGGSAEEDSAGQQQPVCPAGSSPSGSSERPPAEVLVKEEEKEVGVVQFSVYRAYWSAVGGLLAPAILLALLLMQASRNVSDWWLAYWVSHTAPQSTAGANISAYNLTPAAAAPSGSIPSLQILSASDNLAFYLGIYGGLAAANSVFTLLRAFLYAYGGVCAARALHTRLLHSILAAPISFFDVTPIGRIINRFSSDLYAIDDSLPFILNILLAQLYGLLGTLVVTCYGLPWFTLLLVPLAVFYYHIQKFYRRTSRELKRLSMVTLSPVYAHFSESLAGLSTIRALRSSPRFLAENEARLEVNQRANYGGYAVSQWLGIRLQMLGVAMVAGVAFIAVLEHHFNTVDPGLVGLAISYALSVTNLLSGVVTSFTETEKEMVSVERASQYIQLTPEEEEAGSRSPLHPRPPPPPACWPSQGIIQFDNVVLKYREGLPPALDGISFTTQPAEKLGVVGRTGAGKSSLFQALFRMVSISTGSIVIDGVDISTLPLQQLRSVLAVIPQDPFLFSGSVRENLDPCEKHSDAALWSVLERCHLRTAVRNLGGLGSEVGERGRVFSVGERQLVCLARALLTQAKVICLDEATASVDLQTDSQIQQTIRSEFNNSTVITIAHRIATVVSSDRILALDGGRVKELDTPAELLGDSGSLFSALFRENCSN